MNATRYVWIEIPPTIMTIKSDQHQKASDDNSCTCRKYLLVSITRDKGNITEHEMKIILEGPMIIIMIEYKNRYLRCV